MKDMKDDPWAFNITKLSPGVFRTINGNADEMIGVGRIMKAGFPCSRVDVTNAKYDAIIEVGGRKKLVRVQIRGSSKGCFSFIGGTRSGKQYDRQAKSRKYKYNREHCDIFMGINSNNGECYIIPVEDLKQWGDSKSITKLEKYRENWNVLKKARNKTT